MVVAQPSTVPTNIMFRKGTSGLERLKQIEYLKTKIREAFEVMISRDCPPGQLKKEEVSSVMRYLGRFPSEAQIVQTILPLIQEDEPPNNVTYEKFEPFILKCIMENEYEPDDAETLLACFRVLDTEKKGYIDAEAMRELTMNQGIQFFQEVWDKFYDDSFDHEAKVIHYEEYIANLMLENDKHMEMLMKDYDTFQYP